MEITEKDLEDLIFEDLGLGGYTLKRNGFVCDMMNGYLFPNKKYWYRQVPLKSYGIADIIGFTRYMGEVYVTIIELKNVAITEKDFEQLFRYRQAVKTILENTFKRASFRIECILVGPDFSTGHYIHNISDATVVQFKYSLRGFLFTSHKGEWHRTSCKQMHLRDIKCSQELIIPGMPSFDLSTSKLNG